MWDPGTLALPQPEISDDNQPFWDGCRQGELRVQRCLDCHKLRWYPKPMCPHCASLEVEWVATSGKGRVYTWTVIHHVFNPAFADKVPYLVVIVELDEGVRVVSNLLDCPP